MIATKELLGYVSLAVAAFSTVIYCRSVLRSYSKPHAFSWAIWGLIAGISFYAQYTRDAGPGAWAMGFTSTQCFIVAGLALTCCKQDIRKSDWGALVSALMAIALWYFTRTPVYAILLITLIDLLGWYPTFRKSYHRPREEMMFPYILGALTYIIGLLATESYSFATVFYPFIMLLANIAFVTLLIIRRTLTMRM